MVDARKLAIEFCCAKRRHPGYTECPDSTPNGNDEGTPGTQFAGIGKKGK
jgi:hypothetical protein